LSDGDITPGNEINFMIYMGFTCRQGQTAALAINADEVLDAEERGLAPFGHGLGEEGQPAGEFQVLRVWFTVKAGN
jgi:hypothetical protein